MPAVLHPRQHVSREQVDHARWIIRLSRELCPEGELQVGGIHRPYGVECGHRLPVVNDRVYDVIGQRPHLFAAEP